MSTVKLLLHCSLHAFAAIAIFAVLALIVPVYSIYFRHIPEIVSSGTTNWIFSLSLTLFRYWYFIIPLAVAADIGIVFGLLRQRDAFIQAWTALVLFLTIVFFLACQIGLAAPLQKEGLRLNASTDANGILPDHSSDLLVPNSK